MLNQAETDERVQVLAWLPPEKVAEVEGLVDFLRFQDDRHLVRAALVGPT